MRIGWDAIEPKPAKQYEVSEHRQLPGQLPLKLVQRAYGTLLGTSRLSWGMISQEGPTTFTGGLTLQGSMRADLCLRAAPLGPLVGNTGRCV